MLAERARGTTAYNPTVGALVVRDDRIIGEGWHCGPSSPHAEVVAIKSAGRAAAGATMYCTLEPCCYEDATKRTPPCVPFIIQHRIARLVVACCDPNPRVDGTGIAELRRAGVAVELLGSSEAVRFCMQNEGYVSLIQRRRPFVHLKAAQSIDGRIATATGDSEWITDQNARTEAHRLRLQHDAVLIGAGTARHDDPQLTVRHVGGHNPLPILLSSDLNLPLNLKLFAGERAAPATLLFCAHRYNNSRRARRFRSQGVRIIAVRQNHFGLDLDEILQQLAGMSISSILVEGGGQLHSAFVRSGLWDRMSIFIAPKLVGRGQETIGDLGIERIRDAIVPEYVHWRSIGNQMLFSGYRSLNDTFGRLAWAFRERASEPAETSEMLRSEAG